VVQISVKFQPEFIALSRHEMSPHCHIPVISGTRPLKATGESQMSISLSILNRPSRTPRTTMKRSLVTSALPIRLGVRFAKMQRLRALRHMALTLRQLDHPGVLDDFQRATRN
jgi:hypothetical protein